MGADHLLLRSPSAGVEEPSQPSGVSLNRHARFCLPARARSFAPKSVFAVGSRLLVENRTDGQRGGGAVAVIRRPTSTCTGLDSASLGEFWRNNGSDVLKGVSQAVRDCAALGMRQLRAWHSLFPAKCIACGKCDFSCVTGCDRSRLMPSLIAGNTDSNQF